MSRQDHLRAAARCYNHAGHDDDALRCHLAAGDLAQAAVSYERSGRPADAAAAFAAAGQHADAARCWELAARPAEAAAAWTAADQPLRAAWLYVHVLGQPAGAEALLATAHTGALSAEAGQLVRLRIRPHRRAAMTELLAVWSALQTREATPERTRLQGWCVAIARVAARPDLVLRMHARVDAAVWDALTTDLLDQPLVHPDPETR